MDLPNQAPHPGAEGVVGMKCGREVPPDASFCPKCGAAMSAVCSQCGTANAPDDQFCKRCGQWLARAFPNETSRATSRPPKAYTPQHLAEKILTFKSALEGERKQVTGAGRTRRRSREPERVCFNPHADRVQNPRAGLKGPEAVQCGAQPRRAGCNRKTGEVIEDKLIPGYRFLVTNLDRLGGKPTITGTRFSVSLILACLAEGMSYDPGTIQAMLRSLGLASGRPIEPRPGHSAGMLCRPPRLIPFPHSRRRRLRIVGRRQTPAPWRPIPTRRRARRTPKLRA